MTPKQYLEQINALDRKINIKIEYIAELRTKSQNCTQVLCERVQTSHSQDSLSAIISKIADTEHKVNKLIDEYVDLKNDIIAKLDKMQTSDYIEILNRKYFRCQTLLEIAYEMNYSYSQIKRKHGWALEEFKQFM